MEHSKPVSLNMPSKKFQINCITWLKQNISVNDIVLKERIVRRSDTFPSKSDSYIVIDLHVVRY